MFVPFDNLPDTARIWIYQSDRKLKQDEKSTISTNLLAFTNQWTAHNQTLGASFSILHDQFIVLAVDEDYNQASGCSIDASVHAFRNLGAHLQIDFFTRTNVAFWKDGEVQIVPLSELSEKPGGGIWNNQTEVFNNTIRTKGELINSWKISAGQSWLKRHLAKANVDGSN